jgi:uncharacterized protein (TIGR02217 family)
MAQLPFIDLEFPRRIAFHAQRSPVWATTVVETFGGLTYRNQEWANARHEFDVSLAVRTVTDYKTVAAHFYQVRGRANSFPFSDPLDHDCRSDTGITFEIVAGVTYQLGKRYGADNPWDRRITRPVTGTVTIFRTRSGVISTIAATVDYTTGLVTVSGHVAGDTYQWAGQFFTPSMYASDKMPAVVSDRRPDGGELLVHCDSISITEVRE